MTERTIIIFLLLLLLVSSTSFAWNDDETHWTITGHVANQYYGADRVDKKIIYSTTGATKSIKELIQDGSRLEDAGSKISSLTGKARSNNHFHNPEEPDILKAGLNDMSSGMSMILWAQDGNSQSKDEAAGDWSWSKVREHYVNSLLSTDAIQRQIFEANTYKGLGFQIHLLQDAGQPDHVRNDAHPVDAIGFGGIETWTKGNSDFVSTIIEDRIAKSSLPVPQVDMSAIPQEYSGTVSFPIVPISQLVDTRSHGAPSASLSQGIAEYTARNFFTKNTVFANERFSPGDKHYFAYPKASSTDIQVYMNSNKAPESVTLPDGTSDKGIWISKVSEGEQVVHFLRPQWYAKILYSLFGANSAFYSSFYRDEKCTEDYLQKLIPQTVGYSVALLNYFYRGTLNATYTPGEITFHSVKIMVENSTPNEAAATGDVTLVIRYKALAETSLGGGKYELNLPAAEYTYKVVTLSNVNLANPQLLTFDFSTDTLPYYFDDMTMQLVFKGKLGNEEGAVAVSQLEPINGIYSDFTVSLPASGVYAKATDNTLGATFNELRVKVQTDIPAGLIGGSFELALDYRKTGGDPFQSLPVDTEPVNAAAYIIRIPEKNGTSILQPGTPVELVFDLSSVPLPVSATDVYLNIIYKNSGTSKSMAVGYHDISEPTPIDVFNNTDYVCINNQWYPAGDPAAIALGDQMGNHNGIDDDIDTFKHNFMNIYYNLTSSTNSLSASVTNFDLFEPGPIAPATFRRLGFVLTDYAIKYSSLRDVVHINPDDKYTGGLGVFATQENGSGVKHQTDSDGVTTRTLLYNMRGKLMWGGAGTVFGNMKLPSNATCDWALLPIAP